MLFAGASLRHFCISASKSALWSKVGACSPWHSSDAWRTCFCLWSLTLTTFPPFLPILAPHPPLYPWTLMLSISTMGLQAGQVTVLPALLT